MSSFEDAITAKLRKEGKEFEILIDCEAAMAFKKGGGEISEAIVVDEIFTDAKKGIRASKQDLESIFGTENAIEIAKVIIKEGHINLTADYMNKAREEKKKQIIDLISRNAVDPKSGRPHPPQRIETAMCDAKVKIDEHKPAEAQVQGIVNKLTEHLPIRYGIAKMQVKIPSKYTGQASAVLRQNAKIVSERWENDGSFVVNVEIPLGALEKFESAVNNLTKGEAETKKNE